MSQTQPEPWLRGNLKEVHPTIAPVLYSFQHALEDLDRFTKGLSDHELWSRPFGLAPVGFHLRHIGGSVERLLTYAFGGQLSPSQLASIDTEMNPGESQCELMEQLRETLDKAQDRLNSIGEQDLQLPRKVGRKELPTTVVGLLVHMAEHTQRHVGQAIVTAKIVRATSGKS